MSGYMAKNEQNDEFFTNEPSLKYDHFIRISMNKTEGNEKASTKGWSTKWLREFEWAKIKKKMKKLHKWKLREYPTTNMAILWAFLCRK